MRIVAEGKSNPALAHEAQRPAAWAVAHLMSGAHAEVRLHVFIWGLFISWNGTDNCQLLGYAASSFFLVSGSRVFLGARAFTASMILRVNGFRLS
jgi:hypothetical protein